MCACVLGKVPDEDLELLLDGSKEATQLVIVLVGANQQDLLHPRNLDTPQCHGQ